MNRIIPIILTLVCCIGFAECNSSKLNHGVPKGYYLQFQNGQKTNSKQTELKKDSARYSPRTLIIFYDQRIGDKELLKAVKHYKAEIIYQYKTMNGIAITIPKDKTLEESIRYFESVKGVLAVNKDYIYKLD